MKKMDDSDILTKIQRPFKVIGIGSGTTDIIEKVKSFDYDTVGYLVTNDTDNCIPNNNDRMVIFVAKDNTDIANKIENKIF